MVAVRIPEMRWASRVEPRPGTFDDLADFVDFGGRLAVLTGAGCSTESGIPAYRNRDGLWQRRQPIFYQDFMRDSVARRRYWARSFFGWTAMAAAKPGAAHQALAKLAADGCLSGLITQNVDGLHQRAGQKDVVELHGGLNRVLCLDCGASIARVALQTRLETLNPDWTPEVLDINPDGDAELDGSAYPGFRIADCERCGGRLKPDVVFFGESVPRERLDQAEGIIKNADRLLVVGSSLVVFSGFRIVRDAHRRGLKVAAINRGRTRADDLITFKLDADCSSALAHALQQRAR